MTSLPTVSFQTQVSLIYDAVFVFAIGLQTLQHSSEILFSNVSCKDEKALHSGSSLINFINTVVSLAFLRNACTPLSLSAVHSECHSNLLRIILWCQQVEFKGISGQIEFKEGQRNTFKLDLMKLKQNFFVKCGEWSSPTGLNITDYESLFEGNQMNTTWVAQRFLPL